MYEIITFGGLEIFYNIFNALAIMFSKENGIFPSLLKTGLFIGLVWALANSFMQNSISPLLLKWLLPTFVIIQFLMTKSVPVLVIDPLHGGMHRKIDNVPVGIAWTASKLSKLGYSMTKNIEMVMSLPDDFKYHKTGSQLASKIIASSKVLRISNPEHQDTMREFVNQCVVYPALLGTKFTLDDIKNSPNLWQLIQENLSPARSFTYKEGKGRGQILTCSEGGPKIGEILKKAQEKNFSTLAHKLFGLHVSSEGSSGSSNIQGVSPGNSAPSDTQISSQGVNSQIRSYLPLSFQYMVRSSQSAEEIMNQQMMISSIVDGIDSKSVALGNAENFAARRAYLMDRKNQETLGQLSGQKLLSMKNVMEALLYASFILLAPLFVLPAGWRYLGNWLSMVMWVQLWGPLYAILNFIMNVAAQSKSLGLAYLGSNTFGITLANSVGLADLHDDMAAQAGFLTMAVGALAYALVKGGASSFVHLASHLSGPLTSAAARASEDLVSGNYSFGNLTQGTVQAHNGTFGQQNFSPSYSSGSFSAQDGVTSVTTSTDGSQIVTIANSNLRSGIQLSESLSNSYTEQATQAASAAQTATVSAAQSEMDAFRKVVDLGQHISTQKSSGNTVSTQESGTVSEQAQKLHQLTKKFAEDNSISMDTATQAMAEASFGLGGKMLGGSLKGNLSRSSSDRDLFSKAKDFINQNSVQETFQQTSQASQEGRFGTSDEAGKRLSEAISGSFESSQSYRKEASAQLSRSKSYSEMASYTKTHAGSINANLNQEYVDWLPTQSLPNSSGAMGRHEANTILASRPEMNQSYQSQFLEAKMKGDLFSRSIANDLREGFGEVEKAHQNQTSAIHMDPPSSSNRVYQESSNTFGGNSGPGGVSENSLSPNFPTLSSKTQGTQGEVMDRLNRIQDQVEDAKESLGKQEKMITKKINNITPHYKSPGVK